MPRDTRTAEEIFDDMLADDCSFEEIMSRLQWTYGQVCQRLAVISGSLGEAYGEPPTA